MWLRSPQTLGALEASPVLLGSGTGDKDFFTVALPKNGNLLNC